MKRLVLKLTHSAEKQSKKQPHSRQAHIGALAHLARALDWQSKGDRFESDILHRLRISI